MKKILFIILAIILTAGCTREQIYIPDQYIDNSVQTMHFVTPRLEWGRAHIVYLPDGKVVLVGCGSSEDFPVLYELLRRRGTQRIDFVILTSGLSECVGGFEKIVGNFDIRDIYISSHMSNIEYYRQVCKTALGSEGNLYLACEGTRIYDENGVSIDIVSDRVCSSDDGDTAAMSLYLSYGEIEIFVEGECDYVSELELVRTMNGSMQADVFVVPHCGADYLPGQELLSAADAEYAVIPTYSDLSPSRTSLKKLMDCDMQILRTDTDGTIVISIDSSGGISVQSAY